MENQKRLLVNRFTEFQMKSVFGRMPYVDIIYAKADRGTKKNLKLATNTFSEFHVQEKYKNN